MTKMERASRILHAVTDPVTSLPMKFNVWLASLPSTNFQVYISAVLAVSTALVYYVCMIERIEIDSVNFGMWLGFVAAYGGIAYRQFKVKRETVKPEMLDKAKQHQEET